MNRESALAPSIQSRGWGPGVGGFRQSAGLRTPSERRISRKRSTGDRRTGNAGRIRSSSKDYADSNWDQISKRKRRRAPAGGIVEHRAEMKAARWELPRVVVGWCGVNGWSVCIKNGRGMQEATQCEVRNSECGMTGRAESRAPRVERSHGGVVDAWRRASRGVVHPMEFDG